MDRVEPILSVRLGSVQNRFDSVGTGPVQTEVVHSNVRRSSQIPVRDLARVDRNYFQHCSTRLFARPVESSRYCSRSTGSNSPNLPRPSRPSGSRVRKLSAQPDRVDVGFWVSANRPDRVHPGVGHRQSRLARGTGY